MVEGRGGWVGIGLGWVCGIGLGVGGWYRVGGRWVV